MPPAAQEYTGDLGSAVRRTHEYFDRWKRERVFPGTFGDAMLGQMRLAVHEWLVHLTQHADFGGREPQIRVRVWAEADRLVGTVEDNSTGFSAADASETASVDLHALAERRVEVALLLEVTEQAEYRPTPEGSYVLSLSVAAALPPETSKEAVPSTPPVRPIESKDLADWQIILSQAG